jgi:hypothetical protein
MGVPTVMAKSYNAKKSKDKKSDMKTKEGSKKDKKSDKKIGIKE